MVGEHQVIYIHSDAVGVRKPLHGLPDPVLQIREIPLLGNAHRIAENARAGHIPALGLLLYQLHRPLQMEQDVRLLPPALNKLHKAGEVVRVPLQLPAEQPEVPLPLRPAPFIIQPYVAVVVQNAAQENRGILRRGILPYR